jgi:hypothetical protein
MNRLYGNLCTLSDALDRAEELIRKQEVAYGGSSHYRIETEICELVTAELPPLTGSHAVPFRLEQPDPGMADSHEISPRDRNKSYRRLICEAVVRVKDELGQLLSCRYTDYESMRSSNRTMSVFQIVDQDPEHELFDFENG